MDVPNDFPWRKCISGKETFHGENLIWFKKVHLIIFSMEWITKKYPRVYLKTKSQFLNIQKVKVFIPQTLLQCSLYPGAIWTWDPGKKRLRTNVLRVKRLGTKRLRDKRSKGKKGLKVNTILNKILKITFLVLNVFYFDDFVNFFHIFSL